jgi:hypothetical protein
MPVAPDVVVGLIGVGVWKKVAAGVEVVGVTV